MRAEPPIAAIAEGACFIGDKDYSSLATRKAASVMNILANISNRSNQWRRSCLSSSVDRERSRLSATAIGIDGADDFSVIWLISIDLWCNA